jgi:lysophospholipase L1-like esterase
MTNMSTQQLRYLALGDSYTIGEGVQPGERWPVQLAQALRSLGLPIGDPSLIARTGWTTGDLLTGIQLADPTGPFELVSLQIGVNNQYQGGDLATYRREFLDLLEAAIALTGGEPERVMVLSIPDWGVTPFADGRDREQIAAEINAFNALNRAESKRLGARYVDVTPISRLAGLDAGLLAADGLHPSGKMYAAWVEQALPAALEILGAEIP